MKTIFKQLKSVIILVLLLVSTTGFTQNFNEIIKAAASDRGASDNFGVSVAVSGDLAIVGSWGEDEDVSGGNTMSNSGSAYLYERNGAGVWVETQKIVASDRATNDRFGYSVAISGDYIIVGAYIEDEDVSGANTLSSAGSAYIFERNGAGVWSQVQKIVASDRNAFDVFGYSVAVSGNYAIVSAYSENEDASGANSLSGAGSAYVFERNGAGVWSETQKIVASDRGAYDYFGISVAISGNYTIIGAYREDNNVLGGATITDAGSAYIFERNGSGVWTEVQKIVASDRATNDRFGYSVAISGNYVIVGAGLEDNDVSGGNSMPDAGSAYIFERDGAGVWSEAQKIVASDRSSNDNFGISVTISGNYAIVGSYKDGEDASGGNTMTESGSAYIFKRNGSGVWSENQKIVASDRSSNDNFGISVAISGNYAIVGSYKDGEDASGGNTILNAGSVYFFEQANTSSTSSFSITECTTYTVPSGDETYTTIGTYPVMDTIPNVAGSDSVMTITVTILPVLADTHNETVCFGESIVVNGTTYDASNLTGTEVFSNIGVNNCDSTVAVTLTIEAAIDISTVISGVTITSNQTGATYQWIDCNNGNSILSGETNASYTATANGDYAVIVTMNNCSDTSACVNISTVGIEENAIANQVSVYPNPVKSQLTINNGELFIKSVTIIDITGKRIRTITSNYKNIDVSGLRQGIYFLKITTDKGTTLIKVIKE